MRRSGCGCRTPKNPRRSRGDLRILGARPAGGNSGSVTMRGWPPGRGRSGRGASPRILSFLRARLVVAVGRHGSHFGADARGIVGEELREPIPVRKLPFQSESAKRAGGSLRPRRRRAPPPPPPSTSLVPSRGDPALASRIDDHTFPGHGHTGLPQQRRLPQARAADRGSRAPPQHEALRPHERRAHAR